VVIDRSSILASLAFAVGVAGCSAPTERTIVYDDRYGEHTSMDVFLPSGSGPHPAIVFTHGGAWKFFHKERFRSVGRRFAESGYAAASVEYRLVPEGRFPNAVRDGACALAYVQNHANELGIDPNRIVVMGYSAGAQIMGLVATDATNPAFTADCAEGPPRAPQGVISVAGPMDMFTLADVRVLETYLGGSPTTVPAIYNLASPISHVTADDPPFLFIHGTADVLVPYSNATSMQDALDGVGVETTLLAMRGFGHIANTAEESGEVAVVAPFDSLESWIAILDFLERHIGKP